MEYTKEYIHDKLVNYKTKKYTDRIYPYSLYPKLPNTRKSEIKQLAGVLLKELDKTADNAPSEVFENIGILLENRILIEYLRYDTNKLNTENTKLKNAFKVFRDMLGIKEGK